MWYFAVAVSNMPANHDPSVYHSLDCDLSAVGRAAPPPYAWSRKPSVTGDAALTPAMTRSAARTALMVPATMRR